MVAVILYLGWIYLVLMIFNLIPAFPLDGGRVLRSIIWGITGRLRRATYWASLCGQAFAWFLIAVGVAFFITGNLFQGLWLGLIGLFLNSAAKQSYSQVVLRQALHGEPVARFMTRNPAAVPPELDLGNWVDEYVYRYHRKAFPVVASGQVVGFIQTAALANIPRADWKGHTVQDVMRRDWESFSVKPDTDALKALGRMQRTGSSRLLVVDQGELRGIVSLKDLLQFLNLKLELGESEDHPQDPGPRPQTPIPRAQVKDQRSVGTP
jgi:CBS domain-containing protein